MALPIAPFRPRLFNALQGYDRARFAKDFAAGLTVAVVALPLAMAFAIASGLKPEAGLFTAIIAGFIISALGGSRVQIGGPAGAFIVIVYGIVERYGVGNLIIATAMSVRALPMSICPQAMLNGRPSRLIDRVIPVTACFEVV